MTSEQERWAEALAIERQFGKRATDHIAACVTELALAGDDAGVERWIAIAGKYDQLQAHGTGPKQ